MCGPEIWKSFRLLHFDRILKQAVLMLKDPSQSIDTICTISHLCHSNYMCARVCVHTHIRTHLLVTWTSWRQNSCHRLMSLVECVKSVLLCIPYPGEMQMNSRKKDEFQGTAPSCRGCSLLITFSCLLFVPSPICTCNYLFTPGSVQVLLIPFQERSAYVFPRIKSLLELWIQIPTWQLLVFLIVYKRE